MEKREPPAIAVIGAGYWGKNHIRNFYELGALHYICDNDPVRFQKLLTKYSGVSGTTNLSEVLNDPYVSGVVISTPAEIHYRQVKESLLADKDVFVEKPLCLDISEGRELVDLARKKKRILMVGHLLWYHPAFQKLNEIIVEGELGRIQYIYSNRMNFGKIRQEENILWSFAPHDISVVLGLLKEMPINIYSSGGYFLHKSIADTTMTIMDFPSGVKAHIFVSWLHPFKEQKLVVVGDKKMAVLDDVEPENKLILYAHKLGWRNHMPIPEKAEGQPVRFEMGEPLRKECAHFLKCIQTREAPLTDGEEGMRVLSVLDACQKSTERLYSNVPKILVQDEDHLVSKKEYFVHETAVVDAGARIGSGTKIWHFSHVLADTRIGERCSIGQNAVIRPGVTVGDGCKIQTTVSVYKGVTLENDVFCGPSAVFTNVYNPRAFIRRMEELRPTLVKRGATIGANATIVCGITIGEYAFIGAGAVVNRDVPAFALMVGNPAVQKGWMCKCGVRLAFGRNKIRKCSSCADTYRKIGKDRIEEIGGK